MAETYTVLAGALRLRKSPPDGEVLTILPRGHTVSLAQMKQSDASVPNWLHVDTSIHERNFNGYVHADYVMPSNPAPQSHVLKGTPSTVTAQQLKAVAPTCRDWIVTDLATSFAVALPELSNARRLCHFVAQAAHETDGFRTLEEYGGPGYWKKYDGRADLGNTVAGDGSLFHGRGIFQLTGRANYAALGRKLNVNLIDNPDLAAEALWSLRIACEYWTSRGLSRYADANDIETITRKINGSLNGFDERKRYFRRAWSIWGTPGEASAI